MFKNTKINERRDGIYKSKWKWESKINRIVDYFARRPQVQERLTVQIANELKSILKTKDVAIVIDAKHMCVSSRGIQDESSSTVTAEYSGKFKDKAVREEFLKYLDL